ncbi:hypothetical protein [Mycobacterium intracellulare]|uniref:DUF4185 domain-containing protein n=1 Tax=Mycobacterium intracellulare subsp. chimaera TaxID=222805 RepID=A0A7U5RY18_MYCIT|nr:hypothetical protein [Mycobacterium intracellulare]ASL17529.1 hypothetical protein MYCOZU2_05173 [Mycobacterium intracellulare subsp. chimaera]MDM3930514.1 hypothetical protein [Mycobacterium intracellulare subsp. chimaera]
MTRTPPADFAEYQWLRDWCKPRAQVVDNGFVIREVISPGDILYDVQLFHVEADGSVLAGDIGGQPQRGWDADNGHGAIYRIRPDYEIEPVMPVGNTGKAMVLCPVVAPSWFGPYAGDIFFVGQAHPGRAGATRKHLVFRLPVGSDTPEFFAEPPHAGTAGDGIPGALVTGTFGRPATAHEGTWFVMSLMNRTIYSVCPDRSCTVFASLNEDTMDGKTVMPLAIFYATEHWGDLEGELIMAGIPDTSFTESAKPGLDLHYWRLTADGIDPEMLPDRPWGLVLPNGPAVAPEGFGQFEGHAFVSDEGSTNQMHTTMVEDGPLPYDAKIVRIDPEGNAHDFVVNLQGGAGTLVFAGDRLLYGQIRKSYSTGDYHEPDSSVYEIRYIGGDTDEP